MTINELIDELCAIRDLAPGNSIVVNVLEALLMQLFWKDILF